MQNKLIVIYEIVDKNNQPFYIGQTCDIKRRINEHKWVSKTNMLYLYKKIRKLQKTEQYEIKINILVENLTKEQADEQEIYYIKFYREQGINLCNLSDGGGGGLGHKPIFTDEWRKKLSESRKKLFASGYKHDFIGTGMTPVDMWKYKNLSEKEIDLKTQDLKEKHSKYMLENNPFKGKHHTEETKKILAEKAKITFTGRSQTLEHKNKIGVAQKAFTKRRTQEQIEHRKNLNRQNRQKQLDKLRKTVLVYDMDDNLLYELYGHGKEITNQLFEMFNIKNFNFSSIKKVSDGTYSHHKGFKFKII